MTPDHDDRIVVAPAFARFIEQEALPGTGVEPAVFWSGLSRLILEFAPENRSLLEKRDALQAKLDAWHIQHRGKAFDRDEYKAFLMEVGYLVPEGPDFQINPRTLDPEIAEISAPQLVVPVTNARYALNAANARWGSLYDALYGTDALRPVDPGAKGFDPDRGRAVVAWTRDFLDQALPLEQGAHRDATQYAIGDDGVTVNLSDGRSTRLRVPSAFVGYVGARQSPERLLFVHHGLHIEMAFDRASPVGRADPAGVSDVILESALTTIQDCEDSVSAVDVDDKVAVYRNWLGLMKGDLSATFDKRGMTEIRSLAKDRVYRRLTGDDVVLPGRALMLIRNCGHLLTTDLATLDGEPTPEGLIDALATVMIALHDLKGDSPFRNSRAGSIYVVKPKMHGPEEVAFADRVLDFIEDLFGLARHTVKIGIMDEERRTSVNLKESIRAARNRVFFINTGFLDRTGDEIHTSIHAGPMVRKNDMKSTAWIAAYENNNTDVGLQAGFSGRAQIGKGMWAMPDLMAEMLKTKIAHPLAGASTAWVPSPTAATLHAIHYHLVDVAARQKELSTRTRAGLDELLTLPVADRLNWSAEEIQQELDNNAQGILGYVVRWIDQGVGCSKVPDIHNVALMEDRATLRISCQHIANWLLHGICGGEQVMATLRKMAEVVDRQNAGDLDYRPMAPNFDDNIAFQTARALIFEGASQPSGYTEPLLYAGRRKAKSRSGADRRG